jgi:hypothetical protein
MISRKDWDDIVNNSVEDIDNKNSFKVPGRFSTIFQKEIQKLENSEVIICFKHARIYKERIKKNSNFFICDAFCTICKIKYRIILKKYLIKLFLIFIK